MNRLRRIIGLALVAVGILLMIFLVREAIYNIGNGGTKDINNPVPWIIIISVFIPISFGLMIFGWYSWKGEYDNNKHED